MGMGLILEVVGEIFISSQTSAATTPECCWILLLFEGEMKPRGVWMSGLCEGISGITCDPQHSPGTPQLSMVGFLMPYIVAHLCICFYMRGAEHMDDA